MRVFSPIGGRERGLGVRRRGPARRPGPSRRTSSSVDADSDHSWPGRCCGGLQGVSRSQEEGSCCLVVSSRFTLRRHGLYPARLLCLWDSPGKNTGVGCHALLQRIFPTQESIQRLLSLLHWQVVLHWCHLGKEAPVYSVLRPVPGPEQDLASGGETSGPP